MTTRLKKHINLLKLLHKANPKLRKAILQNIDNDALRCLSDCAHNILNGNLPVTPTQLKQLKRHKSTIRNLASKKVALKKKRELIQSGGFVSALLTPLLALAVSLLADKWSR